MVARTSFQAYVGPATTSVTRTAAGLFATQAEQLITRHRSSEPGASPETLGAKAGKAMGLPCLLTGRLAANRTRQPIRRGDRVK